MKKFLFSALTALLFTSSLVYSVTIVSPANKKSYCSSDPNVVNVSGTVTGDVYGCDSTNYVDITITDSSGSTIGSGKALVNSYCIWNIPVKVSPALSSTGSYTITAIAEDGNKATSIFSFTDTTENSISFTYPVQGEIFCGSQTITFSGTANPSTATSDVYIDLYEEDSFNPIAKGILVGTDGTWTSSAIQFLDKSTPYTVNAEYQSCGNIAGTVQFIVDRTNPICKKTVLDPVNISGNNGTFTGHVPAGDQACLVITSNTGIPTAAIPIPTDPNGDYSITLTNFVNCTCYGTVEPCIKANKTTRQSSNTQTFTIDVPANAATLSVAPVTPSSCSYVFSGRGAPLTTVTINQNGKPIGSVEVNASGTYSLTAKLKSGTYSFEAVDEDQYGNQDVSNIVNVTVKNCPVVPPVPPVVPVVRSQISAAIMKKYCCIQQS